MAIIKAKALRVSMFLVCDDVNNETQSANVRWDRQARNRHNSVTIAVASRTHRSCRTFCGRQIPARTPHNTYSSRTCAHQYSNDSTAIHKKQARTLYILMFIEFEHFSYIPTQICTRDGHIRDGLITWTMY